MQPDEIAKAFDSYGSYASLVLFISIVAGVWHIRLALLKRAWLLHVIGLALVGAGYFFASMISFGPTTTMVFSGGVFGFGVSLLAASITLPPRTHDTTPPSPDSIEMLLKEAIREIQDEIAQLQARQMAPAHRQMKLDASNRRLSMALQLLISEVRERRHDD